MTALTRPLVRYHGGKWRLAPWIISNLPAHRCYVEPFGGGGSVLLRKPRSYAEVYNDLDGEIVNLFHVARAQGERLAQLCELTPFARDEFQQSYTPSDDPLEQARRTLIRSFMGFGSASVSSQISGFRANSNRSGTTPAHDWMNYPEAFRLTIQRLRGVVIENREAALCMQHHDAPTTLHYVDPPYVHETRYLKNKTHTYRHEMTDEDHRALAKTLHELQGMIVLSGYHCDLYDELYAGWTRIERAAFADGAKSRTEVLWMNPSCSIALSAQTVQSTMFAESPRSPPSHQRVQPAQYRAS
jgi:DNA adenine methylase